jgi:hypothetical protein
MKHEVATMSDVEAHAKRLAALADWRASPVRTEWGAGMMVADIALSNDETLTIYAHRKAIKKLQGDGA